MNFHLKFKVFLEIIHLMLVKNLWIFVSKRMPKNKLNWRLKDLTPKL